MTDKTTFQSYALARSEALRVQGRTTTAIHYDAAIHRFTKEIGFIPIRNLTSEHIVRLEDKAKEIIRRYEVKNGDSLLPLGVNQINNINLHLKEIGEKAGVAFPLSMYCARHTWASLSRDHNVPISVISSGMGHGNEQITQVYLSEIETPVIDRYNKKLIDSVFR